MNARPLRLVMAVVAVFAVAACSNKPPVQKLPELTFADKKPVTLDVGQLEIVSEYQAPGRAPNYEHLMPISPEAAAIRWSKDRLKPLGRSGFAQVVIKDGSVTRTELKTDKGFTGMFKEEQAERFDGALDVAIRILDERHLPLADIQAKATRSRSLPEGVTVNDRDRALFELTEALAKDVDAQMEVLIRTYFARWVMQ